MIGYTDGDEPVDEGKYLCWVNPEADVPYATQKILMFIDGRWWHPGSDARYRDVVYGFAGPIPALKLLK
jgi:hypothetical protein